VKLFLAIAAMLLAGCATMPADHGITNLRQVAPTAYRSGQPTTPEQWEYIRSLGVQTVVKLDCGDEGGGDDDRGAEAAGLWVYRLCLHPRTDGWGIVALWRGPSDDELRKLDDLARTIADGDLPVLWHCVNGRERTGILAGMVVRYRYGWTREQAYGYMLDTGFRSQAVGAARAWRRWNEEIYKP
jgi:protein tyrosine/serine phosphatase